MGGRPAKKACDDVIATKCAKVAAALKDSSELPASVVSMLAAGSDGCFRSVKEKRHELQDLFAGWIGDDLAKIESSLEACAAEAKAKLDSEKSTHAAAKAAAAEELEKLKAASVEAKAVVVADIAAREEASAALASALTAQREGDAESEASVALKADVEKAVAEAFEPLKAGTVSDKAIANNFVKVIGKLQLDASLLTALPTALTKPPAERGAFDGMAIEQLEGCVKTQLAELSTALAAAAPAREERAGKVAAAQAVADAAAEKAKASAAALNEADSAVKKGETVLEAASTTFDDFVEASKESEAACEEKEAAVKEFRDGPLAAFKDLRDRTVENEPLETADGGA